MHAGILWLLCAALAGTSPDPQSSPVVRAMRDEMERTMQRLQLPGMARPYYTAYTVTDVEQVAIEGSLGDIHRRERDRIRTLKIDLRVGDRALDNSNFFGGPSGWLGGGGIERISLDDDYDAIRREIWLASDNAYKQALETLEARKAARKSEQRQEEAVDSFSQETAVTTIVEGQPVSFDEEALAGLARKISAVFRDYPEIQSDKVSALAMSTCRVFVSSEGALAREPSSLIRLDVTAQTQADDGMPLKNFFSVSARSTEGLPPEAELLGRARRVAEQLKQLRSAPVVEDYTGPVLFEGLAAAQVMRALLAANLSGAPAPDSDNPQMARIFAAESALASRLGKQVMTEGWRVVDDPGLKRLGNRDLVGAYRVDDEGIPAQKVVLIEGGVLKTLLMSRAPRKEIERSNGHGRAGLMGQARVLPGNLIITAKKGLGAKRLRTRLLQQAKGGEEKPLVVTLLDDPGITGVDPLQAASMMREMFGSSAQALPAPLLAYRLSASGKPELVRGARIKPVSIRALREIVAAGKDTNILDYGAVAASGLSSFVSINESALGAVPVSLVSPSLLFEEIEVAKSTGPFRSLPLLSPPGKR